MVFRLNERSRINEDYYRPNERGRDNVGTDLNTAAEPVASAADVSFAGGCG